MISGNVPRRHARITGAPLLPASEYRGVRVFASSVLRISSDHAITGYLFEIDWPEGTVRSQIPIPIDSSTPFWNPRGGNRGGRGLAAARGILHVATAVSILRYDRELRPLGEFCDPHLAGLHEIFAESDGFWVTSTSHDLVLKMGYDGSVMDRWFGSESPVLQRALGFTGRQLNLGLNFPAESFATHYEQYCREERLHANAVWTLGQEVYVLASRRRALVRIRPLPEVVILRDESLADPHNCVVTPDGRVLINDTAHQGIRTFDLSSGREVDHLSTLVEEIAGRSTQFVKSGWQRGLFPLRGSVYLVGVSPATVFEVDVDAGVIGRICRIDRDPAHCIHGLMATWSM
jgi:hypothetical protein